MTRTAPILTITMMKCCTRALMAAHTTSSKHERVEGNDIICKLCCRMGKVLSYAWIQSNLTELTNKKNIGECKHECAQRGDACVAVSYSNNNQVNTS